MVTLDQAGAGRAHLEILPPPRVLEPLIECAWIQDPHRGGSRGWRIVPDASPHVVLVVTGTDVRCSIVGARTVFTDVHVEGRRATIGVRLRPGALPLFTGLPATDFTDRSLSVADVLGVAGTELAERMAGSPPRRALAHLEAFLAHRVRHLSPRRARTGALGSRSVAELARRLGMPLRTAHARVRDSVGFGPKRALRITRLHGALHMAHGPAPVRWADIAAACGYADQSHLVREFRLLLGESPAAWSARAFPADLSKTRPRAPV